MPLSFTVPTFSASYSHSDFIVLKSHFCFCLQFLFFIANYKFLMKNQFCCELVSIYKVAITIDYIFHNLFYSVLPLNVLGTSVTVDSSEREIETWGQFHQCLTRTFYARKSRKRKKVQLSHQYLFTLSGSACVKAVLRTLMKLSPGVTSQTRRE